MRGSECERMGPSANGTLIIALPVAIILLASIFLSIFLTRLLQGIAILDRDYNACFYDISDDDTPTLSATLLSATLGELTDLERIVQLEEKNINLEKELSQCKKKERQQEDKLDAVISSINEYKEFTDRRVTELWMRSLESEGLAKRNNVATKSDFCLVQDTLQEVKNAIRGTDYMVERDIQQLRDDLHLDSRINHI